MLSLNKSHISCFSYGSVYDHSSCHKNVMVDGNSAKVKLYTNEADPTRTKTIRHAYVTEVNKRFRWLRGIVRKAIDERDVFGLKENVDFSNLPVPPEGAYDFPRLKRKVEEFMNWLREQENKGLLDIKAGLTRQTASEVEWANIYIDSSYRQGIRRAYQELNKAGYSVPAATDELVNFTVLQPVHADRLGLLFTRNFTELRGITEAMDQQISRILADGMAKGLSPRQMADNISQNIVQIQRTRARAMARTEVIRAHHQATINTYKQAGVEGVQIMAEWSTAGDTRVCPICLQMAAAGPYELDEIYNLIPAHPSCRCLCLPLTKTEMQS